MNQQTFKAGLGDRVAYKGKNLSGDTGKFFGCVVAMFLNGTGKIRSDEGYVHTIRLSEVEVIREASELAPTSNMEMAE